jgi:hypothetical protein
MLAKHVEHGSRRRHVKAKTSKFLGYDQPENAGGAESGRSVAGACQMAVERLA